MIDHAPSHDRRIHIDEYARLPDDGTRTELVRGRVVREPQPGYEHGRIQVRIAEILRRHIRERGLEMVCVGNIGVIVSEATVRGPDVAVIRSERLPSPRHTGFLDGAPDLAIEIVSPSNTASQIQEKVAEYFSAGSRAVWVVYPERRTIAVHASARAATFLREDDPLTGGEVLPGFRAAVAELFEL